MTPRKRTTQPDWITLTAAGVAGVLTGAGSADLGWPERIALGVTIGLAVAVVLHLVLGKRPGP
jgi:hypothetical protein